MDPSWDPLLRAVFLGRLRLTRLLLEGGAYINESDHRGLTPLMVSVRSKHQDSQTSSQSRMVRYLLDSGADPNIQDSRGRSALVHAVLEGVEPETLSLLLSRGADPALPDHHGGSALVHALKTGPPATLRLLVDACRNRGQEVLIVSSHSPPTCQSLAVPAPLVQQGELWSVLCDGQFRSPPQGASGSSSPQPGSPLLGAHGTADEVRASVLRHSASCCCEEDPALKPRPQRRSPFSRHHSIDTRDAGLLSALRSPSEQPQGALPTLPGHAPGHAPGRSALGRKMSYDGATVANLPPPHMADGLQDVIRRRDTGHYSSDSQLAHGAGLSATNERRNGEGGATTPESVISAVFERRGSAALLLDHIAHTRPGVLPPLNRHAPIPHIGLSSSVSSSISSSVSSSVSSSISSSVSSFVSSSVSSSVSICATFPLGGGRRCSLSKPLPPSFLKDFDVKKTLWRRHSMQSEQIRQLSDFEDFSC